MVFTFESAEVESPTKLPQENPNIEGKLQHTIPTKKENPLEQPKTDGKDTYYSEDGGLVEERTDAKKKKETTLKQLMGNFNRNFTTLVQRIKALPNLTESVDTINEYFEFQSTEEKDINKNIANIQNNLERLIGALNTYYNRIKDIKRKLKLLRNRFEVKSVSKATKADMNRLEREIESLSKKRNKFSNFFRKIWRR